jgi:two-component system, cell cycle response regulator DivK
MGGVMIEYRILVVEDNERNLKLVRDVLQFAGYDVVEARSGEHGVALAKECSPDLVLMDIQLPHMDGAEALHRLRESPETRTIPVVALTAFAMREDHEQALRAGFDGYLEKPISVRDLPEQVRHFLDGKEPRR